MTSSTLLTLTLPWRELRRRRNVQSDTSRELGQAVFAAAASAVLWWSQGGDEARTTRALEALAPDDAMPALDDADGARR